jgi:hypothetical protein
MGNGMALKREQLNDLVSHLLGEAIQPGMMAKAQRVLGLSEQDIVQAISDADPTLGHKYDVWVLKQWVNKQISLPEDKDKVKQLLHRFTELKRERGVKISPDIHRYPNFADLVDAIGAVGYSQMPGVEVVRRDPPYVLLKVTDAESLKSLGEGTSWCTRRSYPRGCKAEDYLHDYGALYIVMKNGKPFIQFTADFNEVRRADNSEVRNPENRIAELIKPSEEDEKRLKQWEDWIGGEDKWDAYEEECARVENDYLRDLHFAFASYEIEDIGENEPYVWYSGGVAADIPMEMKEEFLDWRSLDRRALERTIEDLCHDLDIWGVEQVEILETVERGMVTGVRVVVDLRDEDMRGEPDQFRDFAAWLARDVEDNREAFIAGVRAILIENEYAEVTHPVSKAMGYGRTEEAWDEDQFKHFNWYRDATRGFRSTHAIEVWTVEPVLVGELPRDYFHRGGYAVPIRDTDPGFKEFVDELLPSLNEQAERQARNYTIQARRQRLFWGEPELHQKRFSGKFDIKPYFSFRTDRRDNVFMEMSFSLNLGQNENQVRDAIEFIEYLDNHFDTFLTVARRLFQELVVPRYSKGGLNKSESNVNLDSLVNQLVVG